MKLSMLPVSYFKAILNGELSINHFLDEAVQLKLDAVDFTILFLRNLSSGALKRLRGEVEDRGLHVLEVTTYPDFTHPLKEERERQKMLFAQDMEAAHAVGASLVRVTAGQAHPSLQRQTAIDHAVEGISQAVQLAKDLGLTLVFENHSKPGAWDYYDFDFPTENFLDILKNLPAEVKVQFDTANTVVYGDSPLELLDKVVDRVEIVHIADTRTTGHLEPVVIGTGLVQFKPLFKRLQEADFSGWISIEEASGTGFKGMQQAVEFVRSTWDAVL